MTDYTFVVVGVFLAFIIVLVLLFRMAVTIQPGQLGLVFLLGAYVRTLAPGFNMVHPYSRVEKVRAGSGANGVLAMQGSAETDLAPDRPPGMVRVGDRSISARSVSPIRAGDIVRIVGDSTIGEVLVAKERTQAGRVPSALAS